MPLEVVENAPLRALNSFAIDVRARFLARISVVEEIAQLHEHPALRNAPRLVLGGGSNLLFTSDFDGVVVKIELRGLRPAGETDDAWLFEVGAGENWHATVESLLEAGYPGLENLALIPGLVGAAPIQNIGAYGVELAERLHSLKTWDIETRTAVPMSPADCNFGYRDSAFKRELAGRRIVVAVTVALPKRWRPVASYVDVAAELKHRGIAAPGPRDVFDAVVAIRRRKLPDPATLGNAGSFFKNPVVSREKYSELITRFPSLVGYALSGGRFKIAAGWLIEAAGLKGATRGRAGVYERQALVLVNRGGASGAEILALAREVQDKVAERFDVRLEPEPVIV